MKNTLDCIVNEDVPPGITDITSSIWEPILACKTEREDKPVPVNHGCDNTGMFMGKDKKIIKKNVGLLFAAQEHNHAPN